MKRREFVAALMLSSIMPLHAATAQQQVKPEVVETPFRQRWPEAPYARNIWTMKVFEDRLYLGTGNSSNFGPSSNAGPIPVVSYDGDKFTEEYTVNEEQIARFYQAGNVLFVPGHDSRDDWSYGNLYRRVDGRWSKLRNIPHGIHVYDIRQYGGRLIAAGGAYDQPISAWISDDNAETWKPAALLPNPALAETVTPAGRIARVLGQQSQVVGRFWTLFEIGDTLYASTTAPLGRTQDDAHPRMATLFRFDSARNGFQPLAFGHMTALFPGASANGDQTGLVERWVKLGKETIYIGGWQHNDHQWIPNGLYAATSPEKARRLPLSPAEQPWDILVKDGRLYCLSAREEGPDQFRISVTRFDRTLKNGKVLLTFAAPTFARSFAVYQGRFYFGLGSETGIGASLSEATGTLLRTPFIP
ncbi:sialidase family protein [Sphingobium aquiterrae]|uniref:sialidase family protein n=1 Tax=Sphingobium aquiterrae TaxID=2038656 RepID=UPI003017ED5D